MADLDFSFTITPSPKAIEKETIEFMNKPMTSEKDEIDLRNKFVYSNAFFFKTKALKNHNITDVLWVESNLDRIKSEAASSQ